MRLIDEMMDGGGRGPSPSLSKLVVRHFNWTSFDIAFVRG